MISTGNIILASDMSSAGGGGGDITGKNFSMEIVSIPVNTTKTYTNTKGGIVRIMPRRFYASTITLTVDNVKVIDKQSVYDVFNIAADKNTSMSSSSNSSLSAIPLDIPFNSTFSINFTNDSGVSNDYHNSIPVTFIYYTNK